MITISVRDDYSHVMPMMAINGSPPSALINIWILSRNYRFRVIFGMAVVDIRHKLTFWKEIKLKQV